VRSTKTRITKLEGRNPKEVIVFRFAGFGDEPVLTPEEEAILGAEEERRIQETKKGFVFMEWTKEEAQRLRLGIPPPPQPPTGKNDPQRTTRLNERGGLCLKHCLEIIV